MFSYLLNRRISRVVDGIHSQESTISSGVPQGSFLGRLLFIVFMRDLPAVVRWSPALFVDDTLVYDRCNRFKFWFSVESARQTFK